MSGHGGHKRIGILAALSLASVALMGCTGVSIEIESPAELAATVTPMAVISATAAIVSADPIQEPASVTPPPAPTASSSPTPEETPAPTPNISVTTGRQLPIERKFQPVFAVIGNAPQVRPQTGLMEADIIYEFSLDRTDHATRLLALYADNDPVRVGPIQDARSYFFDLRREWDAMLVYDGYPTEKGYPVYDPATIDFPAEYGGETAPYFLQDKTVGSEPGNTLFCKLTELKTTLYGATGVAASAARFTFTKGALHETATPFIKVGVPFTSSDYAKVEFVYDASDNMLHRYERNSKDTLVASKTLTVSPDGSVAASEPVRVQNLIIQHIRYTDISKRYRDAALINSGECDYFVNGRHSVGKWSRASLGDPTVYTMRDGSPLALEPGTTWILFQTVERQIKIQYEPLS